MASFTRIVALASALFVGVAAMSGCGPQKETHTTEVPPSANPTSSNPPTAGSPETTEGLTEQEELALSMVNTIFEQYAIEGRKGENAYINLKEYHNRSDSGYLWSNFCGVGMQYYLCKLFPEDAGQKETFRKMIKNFDYFRQRDPASNAAENSVKYHSGRGNNLYGGSGDCFFDDNIWVARNFLRAYEILGDEWYLEEAIRVNNWVLSGWNEELDGIVWSEVGLTDSANEQHLERGLSANACSIIVNAKLAQLSKTAEQKAFYTEWAEKFYSFCKKMQNKPESYDYWNGIHTVIVDGVRKDGDVNRVHFSYNSGSMILADLALYELTDDADKKAEYMDDALGTAAAAYKTFNRVDRRVSYYEGDPWFAAILNEAYYELFDYAPEIAEKYLDAFKSNVETAYGNRDSETGLCPYQANEKVSWQRNESYVIHQVGFAQQAVLAALYSKK